MAAPGRWSATPPGKLRPAPRLGEHSAEILREAGYSSAEIDALVAARVTSTAEGKN
jgi:crotonobetainyl-CoA:carnitine CoA-transferase CaiB-like acyl-CoA transferase